MDLTFEPTPRASREEPGKIARTPVERRQSTSPVPRKRRRHDGLHNGKRAPLEW